MTEETFNQAEFEAAWAEDLERRRDIQSASNEKLFRRCFAAYFRTGGAGQPDPTRTGHFMIEQCPEAEATDFLRYVSLSDAAGMVLAVYRSTNRGELKRMRRWSKLIDDGTAETFDEYMGWANRSEKTVMENQARDRASRATKARMVENTASA